MSAAGCFSKPDFRGDADAAECSPRTARPVAQAACGAGLRPLPTDLVIDRRNFFSVEDVDRDGLKDLAIFGHDPAGGQHVFIYFGDEHRNIDVACWDHEIVATGFFRLGGIELVDDWHDLGMPAARGTLFLYGIDAVDHARVRIDELWVGPDRTFAGPNIARATLPLPSWDAGAASDAGFLVWRGITVAGQEIFFGAGDKVYTAGFAQDGLTGTIAAVDNPDGLRLQQAIDVNGDQLLIDDGTHFYRLPRTMTTDPIDDPPRLDGPTAEGAPEGDVYAAHDWVYERIEVFPGVTVRGLRVPRYATPPGRSSLQLIMSDETVDNRPLRGAPVGMLGPYLTDAVLSKNVGAIGNLLAAVVTTFDGTGAPVCSELSVQPLKELDDEVFATQTVSLEDADLPVVTAGSFRRDADRDLLVIYPRRTAADPPTRSACFRAATATSVAPCE